MWINERVRRTLAAGLVVALAGVVAAGCGDDDPAPTTTGQIAVNTVTTGDTPDADGYALTVDGNPAGNVGVNDVLIVPDLTPATYSVALTDVAANCTVAGDNPRSLDVTAGLSTTTTFNVDCPGAPAAVTIAAETEADEVTITWDESALATSYRAELVGGTDDLSQDLAAGTTVAVFTATDDALEDGVTYAATVYAINDEGETASNEESVDTNFFPWDENFPLSLHEKGQGKTTFYNAVPNRGFEEYTGVAYSELACIGCHDSTSGLPPVSGRTCDRCHDTVDPQLGDLVDTNWTDGVCIGCHSRQKLERDLGYTDVHRDMGFECDDCHGPEDVHGDGNEYDGLMDIGAIKAACTNCHNEGSGFSHPAGTDPHAGAVACASCHAASAVTCNNCHFEAQVPPITGKFFHKPPAHNWLWLGNRFKRDGSGETEVYPVNYQSVAYENDTFVAFGFYTPHTITTGRDCASCHNNMGGTNEAIIEYNATGEIFVAEWDAVGETLVYPTGVVPMPNDYLTSLKFDFLATDDPAGAPGTWYFLKAGADTIQVLDFWMTPLDTDQMSALGMTAPAP
jgi:predicted CXXCH cytochrome family protein